MTYASDGAVIHELDGDGDEVNGSGCTLLCACGFSDEDTEIAHRHSADCSDDTSRIRRAAARYAAAWTRCEREAAATR